MPALASAIISELAVRTADGVTLHVDHVRAEHSRGAVLCLHAMMTDGRYFGARRPQGPALPGRAAPPTVGDGFAAALARGGLDVYVADFRGHGRSGLRAGRDDWSFDDLVELDLPAITSAVGPAVILGHSLGGLVAAAAIATNRIAPPPKLLLGATSVWLHTRGRRRFVMAAIRATTALFGRTPVCALRAGTADEAPGYIAQLADWSRHGRWTSRTGVDYRAALARITTPTAAFAGAADWMCTPADARDFAAAIPGATVRVVADADHFQLFTRPEPALREWLIATALSIR
jgi:alpha-beta hydrolase superfamily lysophospholipase